MFPLLQAGPIQGYRSCPNDKIEGERPPVVWSLTLDFSLREGGCHVTLRPSSHYMLLDRFLTPYDRGGLHVR